MALKLQLFLTCLFPAFVMNGQVDEYTSGFPSLDRIHAALGNYGSTTVFNDNVQAVIPSINFTCSGTILSWVFGALWVGNNTDSITELQIWRPNNGDGSYTRVGTTAINVIAGSQNMLYRYYLSSPLPFQAGDILGYYWTGSHLRLIFETVGNGHLLYYYFHHQQSAASQTQFPVNDETLYTDEYHALIGMITDPPGCTCGLMGIERMRFLLGLDASGVAITIEKRQQLTPDMRFLSDGFITKWIVGADWHEDSDDVLYPELQLWRNCKNSTYKKINGTLITQFTENANGVYEYDDFSPIPFQAGDILGMFLPQTGNSKLRLRAEDGHGPTNYYIDTGKAATSPYSSIDICQQQVLSSTYYPLVTVEIVVNSSPTPSMATKIAEPYNTYTHMMTSSISYVRPTNHMGNSTIPSTKFPSTSLYLSVGVSGTVLVLIGTFVIVTFVILCLHRKKNGHVNRRHQSSSRALAISTVEKTHEYDCVDDDPLYVYATEPTLAILTRNTAYNVHIHTPTATKASITASNNVAYPVTSRDVGTADNVAYGVSHNKIDLSNNVSYSTSTYVNK